jgi:hypothetical protein
LARHTAVVLNAFHPDLTWSSLCVT